MLMIRLSRVGKRNSPIFRLVVAEKSRAVKRQNLEILGLYNPTLAENKFRANKERVLFWISKGAQPSQTVNNLLCDFDILARNKKVKTTFAKAEKKKDQKAKEAEKKPPVTGEEKPENEGDQKLTHVEETGSEESVSEQQTPKVKEEKENMKESDNNKEETAQTVNTEKA